MAALAETWITVRRASSEVDSAVRDTGQVGHLAVERGEIISAELAEIGVSAGPGEDAHQLDGCVEEPLQALGRVVDDQTTCSDDQMNSGNTDPWSGDDVPVAPGLGEIVWDTPSAHAAAEGIELESKPGTEGGPAPPAKEDEGSQGTMGPAVSE